MNTWNRIRLLACIIAASFALPVWAQERPAAPGGPLDRAIEEARQRQIASRYAYTRILQVDAEDEKIDRVERFDPRRPSGDRWRLLRENGVTPTEDDLADYDPGGEDERGQDAFELYHELVGELELENAVLVEMTDERAVYRLKETKAAFLDQDSREYAKYLTSRLVVDRAGERPYLSAFELRAEEPFSPSIAAEIERLDMRFTYRRLAETGDVLPQEVLIDIAVDAMIFISVEAKTRIAFTDYEVAAEE